MSIFMLSCNTHANIHAIPRGNINIGKIRASRKLNFNLSLFTLLHQVLWNTMTLQYSSHVIVLYILDHIVLWYILVGRWLSEWFLF